MTTWQIARSFVFPVIVLILVPWGIHAWLEPLSFKPVPFSRGC